MTSSIEELIRAGALFVANHSGGKDSQAMLIRLLAIVPREQLIVVHASLGEVEWPGALEHAEIQARNAGVPFIVARAVKTFFEMVEHRFAVRPGPNSPCWPSATNRQCTSDLKRGPIQREVRRYAKAHGFTQIVTCMGLRAAESAGRAKREFFRKNDTVSNSVATWFEWLPIHALTTEEVFATIRNAGQEPHWAYAAGNDRLSCMFCIMGSRRDLQNAARHNPALLAKYIEIEQRTGYTMHQSRKPLAEMAATNFQRESQHMNTPMQSTRPACSAGSNVSQGREPEKHAAVDTTQRRIWPGCEIPKGTDPRKGLDEGLPKTDLINVYGRGSVPNSVRAQPNGQGLEERRSRRGTDPYSTC
jgi:3'-phosphoadenosine 5'-phosphosulfate sulfotransferase (PAPS reductase)/FAD synthetase